MTLQLAEGGKIVKAPANSKPYIFIPGAGPNRKGIYIREDHFDKMPTFQFYQALKELAPHQREVLNGSMSENEYMLSKGRWRKRREEKQEQKKEKRAAKTERIQSKSVARQTRAEARKARAERGEESEGKKIFSSVLDTAKGIIGSKVGGQSYAPGDAEGGGETKKPWYKTTPGIVGLVAGGLLLVGGVGVAVSRSRKKRK